MTNDTPLVSVLMPVFNGAEWLVECIDSIKQQSYTKWELIMVNDFSTDHSAELMNRIAQNDKRIKAIDNRDKGIIPALTLAFNHSKGAFITRMDVDDLMPPDKLNQFVAAMEMGKKMVVTGKVHYFSTNAVSEGYMRYEKWLNERVVQDDFYAQLYRECIVASPNWMVERGCFEGDILLSTLNYPEDYDLVFRWYKAGYRIKGINELTHLWREHGKRTSRNSAIYQQQRFFELKTNWFIQNEMATTTKVQLIGVGKKGKQVAKLLIKQQVDFTWFDVAAQRYNQPVLGKTIQPIDDLTATLTVLTNWPLNGGAQLAVRQFLVDKGLVFGDNCYLF